MAFDAALLRIGGAFCPRWHGLSKCSAVDTRPAPCAVPLQPSLSASTQGMSKCHGLPEFQWNPVTVAPCLWGPVTWHTAEQMYKKAKKRRTELGKLSAHRPEHNHHTRVRALVIVEAQASLSANPHTERLSISQSPSFPFLFAHTSSSSRPSPAKILFAFTRLSVRLSLVTMHYPVPSS
ncbi:hypothetical protein VTK26DRAFT_9194 [Humicola hyalothermophila]